MNTATPELVHQALFYDSDQAFPAALTGFCLDGLAAGDKILAVTTETNLALLAGELGPAAADVEFVPARSWYDAPGRTLAAYNRYVDAHRPFHPRVRIIGEPIWAGRDPVAEAEWTRYESVINAAFAGSPVWVVCPYDERVLPERITADARRTHPSLVTGTGTHHSPAYTDPAAFTCAIDHQPLPEPAGTVMEIHFDVHLHRMRRRLSAHAIELGLGAEEVNRLVLVVNEVVTNAVHHGGGHGRILLWADEDTVVCDVTDPGRMDIPYPGYLPPDPTAGHGHGLWIVRQLCELLEIRTGEDGTQLRLHLARA
ncbi:sensor histidine kinase [Nonomuraea zeae]|uniref:Sensor histidine kinase n=1 Tax=Nonomuraea zeae TaxID=1642303 RepID=A0A5S4GQC3_9ACTN|nr:sensor histidine kinase [Nonomuraea zeae]TMR35103.1 sensor histidine kinase [Nonomuraea zeae]